MYLGLVLDTIALLCGFALAFGAITIIWRRHWETFGAAESLLARLAAAALMAMVALAGLQYLVNLAVNALQPNQFSSLAPPVTVSDGRNQALAVILATLALAVVAVLRIELYHRRVTGISRRESDDEWQTEESEEKRTPRQR